MTDLRRLAAVLAAVAVSLAPSVLVAGGPSLAWSDLHDGGANLLDDGYVALTDPDGNAIIGGIRTASGGSNDILVRKFAAGDGQIMWTYLYQSPTGNDMALADLIFDHRGDIMVAGYFSDCDG